MFFMTVSVYTELNALVTWYLCGPFKKLKSRNDGPMGLGHLALRTQFANGPWQDEGLHRVLSLCGNEQILNALH